MVVSPDVPAPFGHIRCLPNIASGWSRAMARRTARHASGFTLVELLVVIGIIAVLVAMLLPALQRAKKAANTVQCASNQKQIAMAIIMYAGANKNQLPPARVIPSTTYP